MTSTTIVLILVAIVAAVAVYLLWRRAQLRSKFGPEYDRAVSTSGSAMRAEAELGARAKRVSRYQIKALSSEDAHRFGEAWRTLQNHFVDNPSGAVNEADGLVTELMSARGYPMSDFERRAEDLSVDHAEVVNHYREGHRVAASQAESRQSASTEDLRQAILHYRALFEDLLQVAAPSPRRQPA